MDELKFLIGELTGGDDERAQAAVDRLAALPGEAVPAAIQALQPLLASPDVDSRWWAARGLAALQDPQIASLLLPLLSDPEAGVRQCAALGLRLHPDEQSIGSLAAALEDNDPLVASLAADALADIGKAAVPALMEAAAGARQAARVEAVRALALIGDPRAIPTMMAVLQEDSMLLEHWANEGLDRMGLGMRFFKP